MGGEGLGQKGASRITVPQGDQLDGPGVDLRQSHRSFVRLCSAGGEHGFLQAPGCDPCQAFGEFDDWQGGIEGRYMAKAVKLRLEGTVHPLIALTQGDGQDAAEEIKVGAALPVSDPEAITIGQDQGLGVVVGHRAQQEFLVFSQYLFGAEIRVGLVHTRLLLR